MSKEEVLLELALDKFSNIKKVLNATKDIERFLTKLKQNKKIEFDLIINKTKNLVDSLYDHSVKVRDEFYEHYNKLDNTSIEKDKIRENDTNAIDHEEGTEGKTNENEILENAEDNAENEGGSIEYNNVENNPESIIDDSLEESDSSEIVDNTLGNTIKNTNKDDTIPNKSNSKKNTSKKVPEETIDSNVIDGSSNLNNSKESADEEFLKDKEDESCGPESLLEDPLSVSTDADSRVIENVGSNVVECNSVENEENTNNDTALEESIPESIIEDSLEKSDSSEIEDNTLGSTIKNTNKDDTIPKKSNSKKNTSKEVPEETINSNVIDTSSNLNNSKESADEEEESLKDKENGSCEDTADIKQEPKPLIRLVDLSKLIDPKPKKSVKFDSSVIILTSSDEDSNTPKKKTDIRDPSGKLKSALKNSPNNNGSSDSQVKSRKKYTEKSKTSLSKNKNKENLTKTNGKNENSSDSDILEIHNEKSKLKVVNKSKHNSKKDIVRLDLTEESDNESTFRKSLGSRENRSRDSSSDSGESSTDHKKNYDQLPACNSRRSSRLDNKLSVTKKRRENLRKIFKRKSTTSGRSNFEIVNDKTKADNSDSDSNNIRKKKSTHRKKDLREEHLSDTSSLSDNENEDVHSKDRLRNSKKRKHKIDVSTDVGSNDKFSYKVYIPLPRIECFRMKDIYLNNKEIFEIRSLTKVNLPRSSKRSRATKNDSKSSSDAEKPKSKKSKSNKSKDRSASEDSQTSDGEPVTNDIDKDVNKDTAKEKEDDDNKMIVIVMDKLKNIEENLNKSESDDSESDEGSKKKSKNKKDKEKSKDTDDKQEKDESGSSSDDEKKKNKKKWRKDKLLNSKIDSSDSEEEFSKYCKKKDKSQEEILRKAKKRGKTVLISDSDDSGEDKKKNDKDGSESSDEKSDSDDEQEREKEEEQKKRRRIKRTRNSSSSSDEEKSTRKQLRRLIDKDSLSETTKQAEAEEKQRKARIAEKQKKYNKFFEATSDSTVEKVVLDYDEGKKKELLSVNKRIVKKLKPHQASGVQFMWDACFESLERTKSTKGSGCILAHCMGLGKTLQVIALSHTLITNSEETGVNKIMVVCPLNTVLNWKAEFKKWLPKDDLEIYELVSCKQNYERQYVIQEWHNDGGVLIIGYHMFRNLSNPDNKRISKKLRTVFHDGLLDPGPDLVICDEGHLLKNEKTNLSMAMNRIKTARRIVLTGTPLQNNLKEYWCMVQFIKPNLLGTYKEYLNRFVNPIINGQYTDSTQHDILLMRKRSHVLHKLLDGVVQRRDYAVLEPYLPPKHEYVLFISLTETQVKLYKHYMEKFARQGDGSNRTSFLFTDFQSLQRICTHPRVLFDKTRERKEKEFEEEDSEGSLKDFIDDGEASESDASSSSSSSKSGSSDSGSDKKEKGKKSKPQQKVRLTRALAAKRKEDNEEDSDLEIMAIEEVKEWYQEYCDGEELDNINNSGKLFLLFQILKECEEIGDKILVFSQSLYTLNCIEYFLEKIDEATQKGETEKVGGHLGSWAKGLDYFRLDGSSSCDNRASWCDMFNNPSNIRARLFLISTKAGGLGINLVAANRVIIFDVSWNPSHDIQSIYRVYRFGQTKPCYIYRFVSYGTMEMKVYERQVTKQAISKRVIDEQQIDRHYNQNDLQELYKCDLEPTDRPIPLVPKDVLLGELLQKYDKTIYKYHLHQSLLENKEAEGLNEEERKAAWEEFENEKVLRKNTNTFGNSIMNAHAIEAALASIVRKDNPTWSDVQIKGIIPALVQQLQVQLTEGDMTMYARVQQEMQIMQALHAQKLKEAYYQQQVMRLIQQQEQQAKIMGNMNINPANLARTQASLLNSLLAQRQGGPSSAPSRPVSNDVIELND